MANEDALPSWPSCARAVECAGTQGREPKRLSHTSPSVTRNRRTSTPNSNGVLVVLRKCVGGRWWRHLAGGDSDPVVAGKYRQQLRKLLQDASQCTRCLRKTLTIRFMSAPTRPLAPPIPTAAPASRRQCGPAIWRSSTNRGRVLRVNLWAQFFGPSLWTDPVTKVLERILHGQ